MQMATTVHKPIYVKTKLQFNFFSRNSYHLLADEQTDIIHTNNEKTGPICTKILMNQISQ